MPPVKIEVSKLPQQWLWLLIWTILGGVLRFANLDGKPPWTDEFRTMVLSVGNSFKPIPLDILINANALLTPLIPNPSATIGDIIKRVAIEDRQLPIYFVLSHLWLKLFPLDGGYVSLWASRALPALLGTLSIPCAYIASYLAFRSSEIDRDSLQGTLHEQLATENVSAIVNLSASLTIGDRLLSVLTTDRVAQNIANFTAAMLAVSPYGVFISQEARHYSLAIIWVIISLACMAIACRSIARSQKLPLSLVAVWAIANILGLGTHYFLAIALSAEAMAIGMVCWWQKYEIKLQLPEQKIDRIVTLIRPSWKRLLLAILATAAGATIWWWLLANNYDRFATAWIDNAPQKLIDRFNPLFQILGALISMLSLLLVETSEFPPLYLVSDIPIDINIPLVIGSAILMLLFFAWAIPMLDRGIKLQLRQPQTRVGTLAVIFFLIGSIGLYITIPWLSGRDITRGARYHFVYFPALISLVGLGLASCWQSKPSIAKWVSGKRAVAIVLLMGAIGSTIVATNFGYHKYYRPELIVAEIAKSAPLPVLIASTHNSPIQVGEMMGLAWELRRQQVPSQTQFLLARQDRKYCTQDCPATNLLRQNIERIARAIDLWAISFNAPIDLPPSCQRDRRFTKGVYGYSYQLYHCQPLRDTAS